MDIPIKVGEVMIVPGAGPIGNPLRVTVREVVDGKVKFSTAMGDGECTVDEWNEAKADA